MFRHAQCIFSISIDLSLWLSSNDPRRNEKRLSVRNSFEFLDKIKDLVLEDDEILISFDVTSLFPSIPIREALDFFSDYLDTTTLTQEQSDVHRKRLKHAWIIIISSFVTLIKLNSELIWAIPSFLCQHST